ncbi:MAG: mismatch repair protein [Acidobacteria bacterium]|nr:mismatch repair protein [Acidobacteriota bacterium]
MAAEEYALRRSLRQRRVAGYEKIHVYLGNLRLLLAFLAGVVIWASVYRHAFSPWWILAPILAFAALAAYHAHILRAQELARRAVTFYENSLARVEDRWRDIGATGERFLDPHHIYAADLDLFGKGGLFQLLSAARTGMGEETLAHWLLSPSPVAQIQERQACAAELRDQLDFREDLAVLGEEARVGVHPESLRQWVDAASRLGPLWVRWLALGFALLAAFGLLVWSLWGSIALLVVALIAEAILKYRLRAGLAESQHGAEHALRDLDLLSTVLARIEAQKFHAPRLLALQRELASSQVAASRAISRLRTIVELIAAQHNPVFQLLDVPLMYSVQLAFAAEHWRHRHGQALLSWLRAVGEIEALLSLAAYSFEHPADPFPEFTAGEASFAAEDLGHPLLPFASCTRNSVQIGGEIRVLLVSGSNMSGKSTLLRAIGLNTVLAMTGAPVRAARLRLTPLQIGASIRVNDSLQEGSSRFYAEITRLRQIFDLSANTLPLLFLLDELLQGTNSKDRRMGAEGVLRALVQRGAIGLVSTHDLALTEVGAPLDRHLKNVHFQDAIEDGRMKFDYRLRDGLVTKSNGLELMRAIGLDV